MGQARSHFDFLGHRFRRTIGKMQIRRFIRPKSLKNIRQRIRPLTKRTSGRCLPSIISKLNPVLRGVHEYFHHAYKGELSRLDGWVRGRLRSILRKRNKGKGKGKGKDHFKWPNCYFDRHGLFSLEQARRKQIISLRNGANC
jgi:RNA-directed DNA polymerase